MTTPAIARQLERAHPAGVDNWWAESWGFTFAFPDAEGVGPTGTGWLGGFAQLTHLPRQRKARFVAGVVAEDRPYVLCRDHDLAAPADPNVFDVRGEGLWAHAICETPGEHWTVAMEAFALELDDPADAWGNEHGERVGLAFDLEWEGARGDLRADSMPDVDDEWGSQGRYDTPCEVNGVLQLGDEEWEVAATGARTHAWGMLLGGTPSPWRSDPVARADTREPTDRHTLALAPHLSDMADGSLRHIRRTLDRLTYFSGPPVMQWTIADVDR